MTYHAKYLICLLFVLLEIHCVTSAQNGKTNPATKAQSTRKADTLRKPIGYVNDFASLYTSEQSTYLEKIIAEFEQRTEVEIAIVTIAKEFKSTEDFDTYTLALANKWSVGKKEKNNGILIGINPTIRYMRIQNGYWIETFLSDAETKAIIDKLFTPSFKKGEYYQGTLKGLQGIIKHLTERIK